MSEYTAWLTGSSGILQALFIVMPAKKAARCVVYVQEEADPAKSACVHILTGLDACTNYVTVLPALKVYS